MRDIEKLLIILKETKGIWGRKRFQKIVFLLKEKFNIEFGYDFIPYFYGPYSMDLQNEINLLENVGAIDVDTDGEILYIHHLTDKGEKIAEEIKKTMDKDSVKRLVKGVKELNKRPTESLTREAKEIIACLE